MKQQIIRHGEAILKPVALPKEAILQKECKEYVVAHSETGHHHVLESTKDIQVWAWNGDTYIHVPEVSRLFHNKTGVDIHREQKVVPGTYKIQIKQEFDYFRGIIESVRD